MGTPLLGNNPTTALFGSYIHKYYYNASIADLPYAEADTRRIETEYQLRLANALREIEIQSGRSRPRVRVFSRGFCGADA